MQEEEKEDIVSPFNKGMSLSFPSSKRIRKKSHFQALFAKSKRSEGRYIRIYSAPKVHPENAMAFVASKKVGNAVIRNLVKRRLREILRQRQHDLDPETDLIIVAKPNAKHASYAQLERDVTININKSKNRKHETHTD